MNFKIYQDAEAVARAAADYLSEQIKTCVDKKGCCHVVLPGGTTPARCLKILEGKDLPWQKIHWYPGDERCLPEGDQERNDTMIKSMLFANGNHHEENFHPMPAELGPDDGAKQYNELLSSIDKVDIVVLGMGEDGHTASLFPGHDLSANDVAIAVYNSPKPPPERISFSLQALQNADTRVVIATGSGKREALQKIEAGEALPVALVNPDIWYVDKAAVPD